MLQASPWDALLDRARSSHPLDQVSALAQAGANLERALTAAGITTHDGKGNRLSLKRRLLQARAVAPARWPSQDDLEAAISARNTAVHDFPTAEAQLGTFIQKSKPRTSHDHIAIFYEAWKVLRATFVTKENAAKIAGRFLQPAPVATDTSDDTDWLEPDLLSADSIEAVYLFGSLARGTSEPADIDLLLMDRGPLSWLIDLYEEGGGSLMDALDDRNFLTAPERAAAASGWLDILAINGQLFDRNLWYRTAMLRSHMDPLFFLNIAPDLSIYDADQGQWRPHRPVPFEHLASLRQELDRVGVPHGRRRKL